MQKYIESWIGAVRPWIESEYGSLPEFAVKPGRIINETPWRIDLDYRKKEWVFRFYPKWFKTKWPNDFPDRDGYKVYALVHDLIHFYQQEPILERFSYLRYLPKTINLFATLRFMHWAEGSAELCSWKVLFDQLKSEPKTSESSPDNFLNMLKTDSYKKPLKDYCGYNFKNAVQDLAGVGLIAQPSLDLLKLPYQFPEDVQGDINQRLLNSPSNKQKPARHTVGALRCARIISQTGISLEELLRTPLTNGQLRQEAGI